MDAVIKDAQTTDQKVERVVRAVFGDQDNMVKNPGVIVTVARLEEKQEETNRILTGLRDDFHKVAWIVIGANIAGLLGLLFKK